jgi:hypothetical protein
MCWRGALRRCLVSMLLVCCSTPTLAQIKGFTADRREVLLYPDGTWVFAGQLHLNRPITVLEKPPFKEQLAPKAKEILVPKLQLISAQPNNIVDDKAWFVDHKLSLPAWEIPDAAQQTKGTCPPATPLSFQLLPATPASTSAVRR